MDLDIIKSGTTPLVSLKGVSPTSTVEHIKKLISHQKPSLYPERISLRLQPKGKSLPDTAILNTLELNRGKELYFKDLGPQIGWSTVFLCEYFGPLVFYMLTYPRPSFIYGSLATSNPTYHCGVKIAAACWVFHYTKRLLETIFVHRFSHATMPIANLFKNCLYYWGFAFYVGYFVNHPLYTPALLGKLQIYTGLALFIFAELGNFSIHIALRNLRPPGTKERKIPKPTGNPFTLLFNVVTCPNYTYEILAWIGFSIMTQAVPALLFTVAGGGQMVIWALGKLRNYKKEFPNYPRGRKAIIPFVI
ncbi:putative very-long-chain enoyl-CoA reductase art-1, partial [Fragariocoptes setiger]